MTTPGEKDLVFVFFRNTSVGNIHKFGSLRNIRSITGPNQFHDIEWFERQPDSIPGRLYWSLTNPEIETLHKLILKSDLPSTKRVLWIGISTAMAQDTQAAPVPNDGPSMHDLAVQEILARKEVGLKEYGTLLQTGNGRNFFTDSIEEVGDLLCYLIGAREENRILQEYVGAHEADRAEQFTNMEKALGEAIERAGKAVAKQVEAEQKVVLAEQEIRTMNEIIKDRDNAIGQINTAKSLFVDVAAKEARERVRAVEHIRKQEATFEVLGLPFDPFVEAADVGVVIGSIKQRFDKGGFIRA